MSEIQIKEKKRKEKKVLTSKTFQLKILEWRHTLIIVVDMNNLLIFAALVAIISLLNEVFTEDPTLKGDIEIISDSQFVEDHLLEYKELIGSDYDGYRGHIYRVLTYTMHFLHGDEKHLHIIAAALVYHDLGLWTDSTLSYIEPSCQRAQENLAGFDSVEKQLIDDIINYHHKFTAFEGEHADVVNAVRRADWIDASFGILSKGMPRNHIRAVMHAIPESGFHQTLIDFGPRLHGGNVYAIVTGLAKIFRF